MTDAGDLLETADNASSGKARGLFCRGRFVPSRRGTALAEEEFLHELGHECLRFLLVGHYPVLVENHPHSVFPHLPGGR